MAIGEVYSLKLFGTILGQQFLNTFMYQQVAGGTLDVAENLIEQWESRVHSQVADLAGDYCLYDRIEAFAIDTPSDYSDKVPIRTNGGRSISPAGQPPSYTAYGLRSNRKGAGTRSSYKRFCGLAEDDSDGNALTSTFLALTAAVTLPVRLAEALVHAGGDIWGPVQVKSGWVLGVPPVVNFLINAYGVPYLTSQVSRRL